MPPRIVIFLDSQFFPTAQELRGSIDPSVCVIYLFTFHTSLLITHALRLRSICAFDSIDKLEYLGLE